MNGSPKVKLTGTFTSPLRGAVGPPAECAARLRLAATPAWEPAPPLDAQPPPLAAATLAVAPPPGRSALRVCAWRSLEIEGIFKLKNHFPALFII